MEQATSMGLASGWLTGTNRQLTASRELWQSEESKLLKSGAGDGDRTRDIELGKLAFYR